MHDKQLEEIGRFVAKSRAETLAVAGSEIQRESSRLREQMAEDREALLKHVEDLGASFTDSLTEIDHKRNQEHLEAIQKLTEQIRGQEVFEAQLTERLASIKDGETGPQGEKGLDGEDGLDRPLVDPVELVSHKNYPKNTLGTFAGGLWISTKQTLGDPENDPHSWHCILDAMTTLSVELQEDHTFKLSVRTSTGSQIETDFEIPFPKHEGIHEDGRKYLTGQIVTKGSSMWQALEDTEGTPPGNGWKQIMSAPRGRAGKDGKTGPRGPQGVPGRNGADAILPDNFVEDVYALATKAFEDGRSDAYPLNSFRGTFYPRESYIAGDVVSYDGNLFVALSAVSGNTWSDVQRSFELVLGVPKLAVQGFMDYQGGYQQKAYKAGDVVVDGAWTMCALRQTTDRAAPYPIGDPFNVYQGTMGTAQDTQKLIVFGNRYTFDSGGYLNGYRVYTVSGNYYQVKSVIDPETNPQINNLLDFTADTTGWVDFNLPQTVVYQDQVVDVLAYVNEPDPSPTTWSGFWDYTNPQNAAVPAAGQFQHANSTQGFVRVAYVDDDAGDRSTELQALTAGDHITAGGFEWTITYNTDGGSYAEFGVAPAQQSGAVGRREFTYDTVSPTPITYGIDADYWTNQGANERGFLSLDGNYEDKVISGDAYGIDLLVQQAEISDDWGYVAYNGDNATAPAAQQLTAQEVQWVSTNTTNVDIDEVTTTGAAWKEVALIDAPLNQGIKGNLAVDARRIDQFEVYTGELDLLVANDNGTVQVWTSDKSQMGGLTNAIKAVEKNGKLSIQVRGQANQQWLFRVAVYYRRVMG